VGARKCFEPPVSYFGFARDLSELCKAGRMLIYGVVFKSLYVDYPDGIELTLFVFFMALINLVEHIIFIVFHLELL